MRAIIIRQTELKLTSWMYNLCGNKRQETLMTVEVNCPTTITILLPRKIIIRQQERQRFLELTLVRQQTNRALLSINSQTSRLRVRCKQCLRIRLVMKLLLQLLKQQYLLLDRRLALNAPCLIMKVQLYARCVTLISKNEKSMND